MRHVFTGEEIAERARLRRELKTLGLVAHPYYGGRRYKTITGYAVTRGAHRGAELVASGDTFTRAAYAAIKAETPVAAARAIGQMV